MYETFPPLVVLSVLLLLLATLGAGGFLWFDGRRFVVPSTAARRAIRHARVTTAVATVPFVVGLGLPLFGALGSARVPPPFLLASLPLALLVGVLVINGIGEMTWPRPQGATRQATLTARTAADVSPSALRHMIWGWAGATVVAAIAFALVASGPRRVSRVIDQHDAFTVGSFPGVLWTGPVVAVMLVVLVLCEMVLRLVASRPAVPDVSEEWDMWLRRRVARRLLRIVQLMIGLTLGGLVALAGLALRTLGLGNGSGVYAPPPSTVHVVAGNSLLVLALALLLVAVATAVWPASDPAPDVEPVRPVGATS
ncbi:hypothetical protein [Oerskovia turbata]|uniref:hypothetical protein n=1 Tax=Oerskovia turbata TaxID=1713 RepID=UPI000AA62516|nr:hypothetical protein [Oerskovia turbata]